MHIYGIVMQISTISDTNLHMLSQCSRQAAPLRDYCKKIRNGAEIFTVCIIFSKNTSC